MSESRLHTVDHAMHQHALGRQLFYISGRTKAILKSLNGTWGFQYLYDNGMPGPIKFNRRTVSESIDAFFKHKTHPRRNRFLQWEEKEISKEKMIEAFNKPISFQAAIFDALKNGVEVRVPHGTKVTVTYY